jgi:hypothetical protein
MDGGNITPEEVEAACKLIRPGVSSSTHDNSVLSAVRRLWRLEGSPSGDASGWGGLRKLAGRLHTMKDVYDKHTRRRLIWLRNAFAAARCPADSTV